VKAQSEDSTPHFTCEGALPSRKVERKFVSQHSFIVTGLARSPPVARTSARPAPVDVQRLLMVQRSRAILVGSNQWMLESAANSKAPSPSGTWL
jgi:hypothetical protein